MCVPKVVIRMVLGPLPINLEWAHLIDCRERNGFNSNPGALKVETPNCVFCQESTLCVGIGHSCEWPLM